VAKAVHAREAAAVRDLLSRESGQLAADVRKAGAKWSKRVLERVKTEMSSMSARKAMAFRVSRNSVPADMMAVRQPSGARNRRACMTWSMSRSQSKGGFAMTRS
jgi:hypothetical protein